MKRLISTLAIACMLLPSMATAQGRRPAPANQQLEAARISDSPEFIDAAKRRDVATMRRLLRGTGAVVQEPDPSFDKLCLPPKLRFLIWVIRNNKGSYEWVCAMGATQLDGAPTITE